MNKFAWAGIAYAIYLGVRNWEQLQELQKQVDAFTIVGRHIQ